MTPRDLDPDALALRLRALDHATEGQATVPWTYGNLAEEAACTIERLTDERDATRKLLQVTFRILTERNEEIAALTARELKTGVPGKGEGE